jgi:PAS domain-containing protein
LAATGPGLVGGAPLAALLLAMTGLAQREARRLRAAAINERELRSIFDTVSAGLVQMAPDGRILNANPAYRSRPLLARERGHARSI